MDITQLLTFGVEQNASDCHISSEEPPMLRINGDLKKLDHPVLGKDEVHNMIFDMMNDAQRRAFQEHHECDFSFELGEIARFRVNVFVQRRGEGAVFRTIPTKILPLEQLGMPPILRSLCEKEKGLVLVTGPTGSGKSTTLAAMLDYLNDTYEGHILTIEDPIEFMFKDKKSIINQREVGIDVSDWHTALKHAVREDPDVRLLESKLPFGLTGGAATFPRTFPPSWEAGEVSLPALDETLREMGENVNGKPLVDVTNVVTADFQLALGCTTSGAEELQKKVPGAKVIKAFNTVFAEHMYLGKVKDEPITLFAAGDDGEAKAAVLQLGREIGFDAVDAGPLQNARWLETLGYFHIQLGYVLKMGSDVEFKLIR